MKDGERFGRARAAVEWSLVSGLVGIVVLLVVTTVDALTRADGYDMSRHWISLLQRGDRGEIGTVTFVVSGLALLGSVPGLLAVRPSGRRDSRIPALVATLGGSLLLIAAFPIDPSTEYPVPLDRFTLSWSGRVHSLAGTTVIVALAALCIAVGGALEQRPGSRRSTPIAARTSGVLIGVLFLACSAAVAFSTSGRWEAARIGAFQRFAILLGTSWLAWYTVRTMMGPDIEGESWHIQASR